MSMQVSHTLGWIYRELIFSDLAGALSLLFIKIYNTWHQSFIPKKISKSSLFPQKRHGMRVVMSWHLAPAPGMYRAGSQHPPLPGSWHPPAHEPRLHEDASAPSSLDMASSLQKLQFFPLDPKISSLIRRICLAMQGNSLCLCSFTVTDKEAGVLCLGKRPVKFL